MWCGWVAGGSACRAGRCGRRGDGERWRPRRRCWARSSSSRSATSPLIRLISRRMRVISSSSRGGVDTGPVVDSVDGGGQPFAGAQQIIEVRLQVGQEGNVGAEMITTRAAEPDRAGSSAGCDVGRFGAGAVGHGDLADGVAGAFGFQQRPRVAPDPVAVPIEAERGDGVDRGAAAVFTDAVVPAGHGEAAVIEQLGQHVDRNPGVGVSLGVGVTISVRHYPGLVELDCRRGCARSAAWPASHGDALAGWFC